MGISSLIPADAQKVRSLTQYSYSHSKEGCLSARLKGPAATLGAGVCSFVNTPVYLVKGTMDFAWGVISCNKNSHLTKAGEEYWAAGQSLIFSAFSIAIVALGVLFPQTIFACFELPQQDPPSKPQLRQNRDQGRSGGGGGKNLSEQGPKRDRVRSQRNKAVPQPKEPQSQDTAKLPESESEVSKRSDDLLPIQEQERNAGGGRGEKPSEERQPEDDRLRHRRKKQVSKPKKAQSTAKPAAVDPKNLKRCIVPLDPPHRTAPLPTVLQLERPPATNPNVQPSLYPPIPPSSQSTKKTDPQPAPRSHRPVKVTTTPPAKRAPKSKGPSNLQKTASTIGSAAAQGAAVAGYGALKVAAGVAVGAYGAVYDVRSTPLKLAKYLTHMQFLQKEFLNKFGDVSTIGQDRKYAEIIRLVSFSSQDPRGSYQKLHQALVELTRSQGYQDMRDDSLMRQHIGFICSLHWTGTSTTEHFQSVITTISQEAPRNMSEPSCPELSVDTFFNHMRDRNVGISRLPQRYVPSGAAWAAGLVKQASGHENLALKNVPTIRGIQVLTRSSDARILRITNVRHGSPTMVVQTKAGWGAWFQKAVNGNTVVDPSFLEAVRYRKMQGEGVFLTSLQRNESAYLQRKENEQPAVQALIQAQANHPNLFVLVQPMEGALWDGTGKFNSTRSFKRLNSALVVQFSNSNGMHVLPRKLLENYGKYQAIMKGLFTSIQQVVFPEAVFINKPEQRSSYILLCYLFQRLDLQTRLGDLSEFPVAVKSNPCKNYVDRGGITALIENMVHALYEGKLQDVNWMEKQVAHLVGAAYDVVKRPVYEERIAQAEHIHKLLLAISGDSKRLAQFKGLYERVLNGWSISGVGQAQSEEKKSSE